MQADIHRLSPARPAAGWSIHGQATYLAQIKTAFARRGAGLALLDIPLFDPEEVEELHGRLRREIEISDDLPDRDVGTLGDTLGPGFARALEGYRRLIETLATELLVWEASDLLGFLDSGKKILRASLHGWSEKGQIVGRSAVGPLGLHEHWGSRAAWISTTLNYAAGPPGPGSSSPAEGPGSRYLGPGGEICRAACGITVFGTDPARTLFHQVREQVEDPGEFLGIFPGARPFLHGTAEDYRGEKLTFIVLAAVDPDALERWIVHHRHLSGPGRTGALAVTRKRLRALWREEVDRLTRQGLPEAGGGPRARGPGA